MFEILKQPKVQKLLILAMLIRFLIMPFYFHPDIKTYYFQSSFLKSGVLNIYDYLSQQKDRLPLKDGFVYFPLTYFFLGTYQFIVSPFLGEGFENWLFDASSTAPSDSGVFRYLFILKIPYLIFDVLIALFLTTLFSDLQTKKKVLTFWLFNPFSVALIYMYSNIDIIPVFLIILSLYFMKKNNFIASPLVLGLGAGFKAFPLLLVPFLFLKAANFKDRMLVVFFSFGVFLLTIIPFINSPAFRESTLVSGLTTRIISSGLGIGFGEILMPAVILLSILLFWGTLNQKVDLWRYYLTALLLTLISIHFHLSWLLWTIPFFAISFALERKEEKSLMIAFLLIAFIIPLLYQDKSMTVSLLSAISPLFSLLPTPATILGRIYDPLVIQGVLHSILFGLGLLLSWRIINKK